MKNLISFLSVIGLCAVFSSCATAIKTPNVELTKIQAEFNSEPQMDFIGFKIDSHYLSTTQEDDSVMSEFDLAKTIKNSNAIRNLGFTLESARIAQDKSAAYFGVYSSQELEQFKNSHRYISFVEIAQSKFNWDDNKTAHKVRSVIGGALLGEGSVFTIFGAYCKGLDSDDSAYESELGDTYLTLGIPSLIAGTILAASTIPPTKTKIKYEGLYNIYIYDTQSKELIRRESVSVNLNEKFEGSYDYDTASKNAVNNYISAKTANALLEKYQEINSWLKNR